MALRRAANHVFAAAFLAGSALGAQVTPTRDDRPTIAVLGFTGGSLQRPGDYAALGRGISELLITGLAANDDVRVADRQRLNELLAEQHLSEAGSIEPATVVRLGRILGVRHFITGGFLIDAKEHMRIDVRSVNVETSEMEYRETIEGKVDDLFALVDRIEKKISAGLRLPRLSSAAAALTAGKSRAKGDERVALEHLGRATLAADKGDTTAAMAALRDALKAYPEFEPATKLQAALTKSSSSKPDR